MPRADAFAQIIAGQEAVARFEWCAKNDRLPDYSWEDASYTIDDGLMDGRRKAMDSFADTRFHNYEQPDPLISAWVDVLDLAMSNVELEYGTTSERSPRSYPPAIVDTLADLWIAADAALHTPARPEVPFNAQPPRLLTYVRECTWRRATLDRHDQTFEIYEALIANVGGTSPLTRGLIALDGARILEQDSTRDPAQLKLLHQTALRLLAQAGDPHHETEVSAALLAAVELGYQAPTRTSRGKHHRAVRELHDLDRQSLALGANALRLDPTRACVWPGAVTAFLDHELAIGAKRDQAVSRVIGRTHARTILRAAATAEAAGQLITATEGRARAWGWASQSGIRGRASNQETASRIGRAYGASLHQLAGLRLNTEPDQTPCAEERTPSWLRSADARQLLTEAHSVILDTIAIDVVRGAATDAWARIAELEAIAKTAWSNDVAFARTEAVITAADQLMTSGHAPWGAMLLAHAADLEFHDPAGNQREELTARAAAAYLAADRMAALLPALRRAAEVVGHQENCRPLFEGYSPHSEMFHDYAAPPGPPYGNALGCLQQAALAEAYLLIAQRPELGERLFRIEYSDARAARAYVFIAGVLRRFGDDVEIAPFLDAAAPLINPREPEYRIFADLTAGTRPPDPEFGPSR